MLKSKFFKLSLITLLVVNVIFLGGFKLVASAQSTENSSKSYIKIDEKTGVYYEIEEIIVDKPVAKISKEELVELKIKEKDLSKEKENKKLNQIVRKKVYIEKDQNGNERKLTFNDIDKINQFKKELKNNFTSTTGDYVGGGMKTIHELTLTAMVYELNESGKVGYKVTGIASWESDPSILTPGSHEVSSGNDCFGFSWGGGYDYTVLGFDRLYVHGKNTKENITNGMLNPGVAYNVGGADTSRGWSFPELLNINVGAGDSYWHLYDATAKIKIHKPNFSGGTTKLYIDYAHTYSSKSYSFSIGYMSADITVSPTKKFWTDFIEVDINK